ncbi:unnamed protein product [Hermetia illucens]|uniref:Uncharacterized protein n=1 Tax=Hermetia illucens TaxID=343691 RepID=A0A7R8UYC7_HERIL|nr:unnamed protein product [Hermetia illucens]
MMKRWHKPLKAAILCHNTSEWIDLLPTVLLELRTRIKDDVGASVAELVYGMTFRYSGEFLITKEQVADPKICLEKFREHMRQVRLTPTAHH